MFGSHLKGTSSQNDVLQWIIDRAVAKQETDSEITERLLLLNLAAIHTSSSVRASTLFSSLHSN